MAALSSQARMAKELKGKQDFQQLVESYDNWLFDCDGTLDWSCSDFWWLRYHTVHLTQVFAIHIMTMWFFSCGTFTLVYSCIGPPLTRRHLA